MNIVAYCYITYFYFVISMLIQKLSTSYSVVAIYCPQVSEYLKKQMVPSDGAEISEDIKQMLESHDKLVEEIFQHEDKDKNGFISHEEFSGPKHDEL